MMETAGVSIGREQEHAEDQQEHGIIVRADEVDEAGVDISTITTENDEELGVQVEARRLFDSQDSGNQRTLANQAPSPPRGSARPILRREGSAPPPPPNQPPPPAPHQEQDDMNNPTDSLSLAQLRNIVRDIPKIDPTAYAYTYEDTRSFPEELGEWFQYTEEDRSLLLRARDAFDEQFEAFIFDQSQPDLQAHKWLGLPLEYKKIFVSHQLQSIRSANAPNIVKNLECLTFIALGVWNETAWVREDPLLEEDCFYDPPNEKYRKNVRQLRCIKESAKMLCDLGAVQTIFDVMRSICDSNQSVLPRSIL